MRSETYITLLLCFLSLSGFGQSNSNTGIYLGYGKWNEYSLLHGGAKLEHNISRKLSINSGILLNTTGIVEIPLQLQYNFASTKKVDLNVFSGIAINYILLEHTDLSFYGKPLENNKYEVSAYGRKVERPLSFALSNGVALRFNKRLDINFTFNYGIHDIILKKSDQYIVDAPINWEKIEEGYFVDPDEKLKNTYFALGIVYWNPLPTAERSAEIRSNQLHRLNAIFVEFLGTLGIYSLNYDRILLSTNNPKKNIRLAIRGGFNYFENERSSDINYLFGFSGLLGSNGHYFELGFGMQSPPNDIYDFGGHKFIGYRYQKNILFLRGGFTLLNSSREEFLPWLGLGVGVAF